MIEKYKTNQYWYRIISMLLILALSVNLLAGCSKNTGNEAQTKSALNEDTASVSDADSSDGEVSGADSSDSQISDKDSSGSQVSGAELLASSLDKLEEEIKNGSEISEENNSTGTTEENGGMKTSGNDSVESTSELMAGVTESLDVMSVEAESITDNSEVMKKLSSDTQALLAERAEEFKADLTGEKEKIEEAEKKLEESFSNGDTDKSLELIEEIRGMAFGEPETHTYGTTPLPETVSYAAEEAELCKEECPKADKEDLYSLETSGLYNADNTWYTERITNIKETDKKSNINVSDIGITASDISTKENINALNTADVKSDKIYGLYKTDSELTACTDITSLSDDMKQLADELDTPLAIYNYIKNNTGYEYYYGSRKGAEGTYHSMNGNDVDQASLLIAMLRYKGYQAEYVYGDILLKPEKAMSLTGAATAEIAADVLASGGVHVTKLKSDGKTVSIRMEHVWVRTLVPYGNYRGAGEGAGEPVWIDLDTGIKEYEAVRSIYDTVDKEAIKEETDKAISSGDVSAISGIYAKYAEEISGGDSGLSDTDTENTYVRKRIIKQKDEMYLPLSLQYQVDSEKETFAAVPDSFRDKVSFDVDGCNLGSYYMDELSGKSILLSYEAATAQDSEILNAYGGDLFSVPAYAVYMTPVLYVDNQAVSGKDEELLYKTLGSDSSFHIVFHTKTGDTEISNEITTGSVYAVTFDVQSISAAELESSYNEATAYAENATWENIYSPDYMGRYLAFAGKLYFAQLDILDIMASDSYDVAITRNISEAMTGYAVEREYLYGTVSGIDFGGMFIDVNTDSHSVASLTGDKDSEKEYMFATGIESSRLESGIWEELTGESAVSTISIFEEAKEQGTDILIIHEGNLEEELALLNTTDDVSSEVISSVNSGHTVMIPEKDVTVGSWSGTGYIILDRNSGSGIYRISGGLNGGALDRQVAYAAMVEFELSIMDLVEAVHIIASISSVMAAQMALVKISMSDVVGAALCASMSYILYMHTLHMLDAYISGNDEAGKSLISQAVIDLILTIGTPLASKTVEWIFNTAIRIKLGRMLGKMTLDELINCGMKLSDINKYIKELKALGLTEEIITDFAKNFGKPGMEWLRKARGLSLSEMIIEELSKLDGFEGSMDEILELIKGSSRNADDVAECIIKYGDDAKKAIEKYGDEAVDAICSYGKDALDAVGKYGDNALESIKRYGQEAVDAIGKYGDEAVDVIGKYGDDAVDGFKDGKTPAEVEKELGKTTGKYSEKEIQDILENIRGDGFKNNPLRQAYEEEVAGLKEYGEELLASGMSEKEVAKTLNQARRDLGIKYKDMTPQPLRDYIYEINMGRYKGDKLGPTYEYLKSIGKSDIDIINSSSKPNTNIDKLLSGFEEWLRRQ